LLMAMDHSTFICGVVSERVRIQMKSLVKMVHSLVVAAKVQNAQALNLRSTRIDEDGLTAECYDQAIFRVGESGMRIWEAGIVMARVVHSLRYKHFAQLLQIDLGQVTQVLELGSGTGIGVLPIVKDPWPFLEEVICSDHMDKLVKLASKNIKLQSPKVKSRAIKLDWLDQAPAISLLREREGLKPQLILSSDVVFDGSNYADFVKVVATFRPVKVLVVMPSDDRHWVSHFCRRMAEVGFKENKVALGKTLGFAALGKEQYSYQQAGRTGEWEGSNETLQHEEWTRLYPGLIEQDFYVHIFS